MEYVNVFSEAGGVFRMENPWQTAIDQGGRIFSEKEIRLEMQKGERMELRHALD